MTPSLNKIVLVVMWCWTAVDATLVVKPRDVEVYSGKKVVLQCATDLPYPVDWQYISNEGKEKEIYSSGAICKSFLSQCAVEENHSISIRSYNLVIFNATKRHEGHYKCIDNEGLLDEDVAMATVKIVTANDNANADPLPEYTKQSSRNEGGENTMSKRATKSTLNSTTQSSITSEFNNETLLIVVISASFVIILLTGLTVGYVVWRRRAKKPDVESYEQFLPSTDIKT